MSNPVVGAEPCTKIKVRDVILKSENFEDFENNWENFAKKLKVYNKLISAKKAYKNETKPFTSLLDDTLLNWTSQNGSKATLQVLCQVLKDCDFGGISEELQNHFNCRFEISEPVTNLSPAKEEGPVEEVSEKLKLNLQPGQRSIDVLNKVEASLQSYAVSAVATEINVLIMETRNALNLQGLDELFEKPSAKEKMMGLFSIVKSSQSLAIGDNIKTFLDVLLNCNDRMYKNAVINAAKLTNN